MSNLINKAKDALSGNKHESTSTSNTAHYDDPRSTNAGPHSSNLGNKVDPRVDSDRDHRNDPTSRTGGYGNTQDTIGSSGYGATGAHGATTSHGTTGTTGGYGTTGTSGTTGGYGTAGTTGGIGGSSGTQYDNPRSTNEGPHSSNLANKLDPRVDSDRDGRNDPTSRTGGYGQTQTGISGTTGAGYGHSGATGTTGAGYGSTGTSTGYGDSHSTNAGPHSSNLANKLDPRVDSDRDGRGDPTSRTGGYGQTHGTAGLSSTGAGYGSTTGAHTGTHTGVQTGGYGNDPHSTNAGPHSSNLANKADPRVDSDRDGRSGLGQSHGTAGTASAGYGSNTGTGQTTSSGLGSNQEHAHDSSLLNRLDPRVKTDSKGNPTY